MALGGEPRMTQRVLAAAFVLVLVLTEGQGGLVASEDAAYWIEFMRGADSEARKEGREALIAIGAAAVPALIEATHDPDDWIRWEAVNALGSIAFDDPDAVIPAIPALAERALTDTNSHPRWRSLWALATFPDAVVSEQVVPLLWAGLESDDERIVWNTAVALAFFRQPEAAPMLNQGLDASDDFQAWEAVYCLGMVHDEESVPLLTEILTDVEGREKGMRQEAAMTLGRIDDPAAIPALIAALEDPEAGVRWRAAQALSGFGDPGVIPAIESALAQEEDEFAAEQMRKAVEKLEEEAGAHDE